MISRLVAAARRCAGGFVALVASLGAIGCAHQDPKLAHREDAQRQAAERGFVAATLNAGGFDLTAYLRRPAQPADTATIYIEGDGAGWPSPWRPPPDPTPKRPLALMLALEDGSPAVAYLGRPCQYLGEAALAQCSVAYWTERRFAPEVLAAYDGALDRIKAGFGTPRLRLVGYSGGGVLAALLAARRPDIDGVVTVAAPLAVKVWLRQHGATPLAGSLDPIDDAGTLRNAVHFAGGDDKTVAAMLAEQFARTRGGTVHVVPGFDHECCWVRDWRKLLPQAVAKEEK